jgi:hypothetical protein
MHVATAVATRLVSDRSLLGAFGRTDRIMLDVIARSRMEKRYGVGGGGVGGDANKCRPQ